MRILFLSITFIRVSIGAFAQNPNAAALSLGTSFAKTDAGGTVETHYRPGMTGALSYQRRFGWFVAEGALDYTQKGNRQEIMYTDANANVVGTSNFDQIYNYIGLSLKAGVRYGDRLFGTTTIGLTPALLASARYRTYDFEYNGNEIKGYNEKLKDISSFDLSANLETSVGYRLGERGALFLGLNASLGLLDVKSDYYFFAPAAWKNHYFTTKLGYQYSF